MNTPNPLMPQGSLEEYSKRKSHIRIAVFSILAVHVAVVVALLIQGCKREDTTKAASTEPEQTLPVEPANDAVEPFVPPTAPVGNEMANNPPGTPGTPSTYPPANAPATPSMSTADGLPPLAMPPGIGAVPPPTVPSAGEHTIARGDTLAVIAKKHGVSLRDLQAANPGMEPTRLRIGQKVQIPAKPPGSAAAPSATALTAGDGAGAGNGATYVVKSGDTLSRIARAHGTSSKALRSANNLRTDQIRVGQKLKLPAKSGGSAPAPNGNPPAF